MNKPNFKLLKAISECPPGTHAQLDESMCEKLKELLDKPNGEVKVGLKYILDACVHGGLASSFIMVILEHEWKELGGEIDRLQNS